ncbi:sensor histidine kinase [Petroclostridium sp. X23]|uniref:sensor histidine kinase n=1 Tax=Petroclostridium sp. X23 TaxID=3045146 RepID=UPI0024AE0D08|nr:sensor histidine kinase [Petroclostridium sp. X23]WHH59115.1 sensor histidine kinase [Petroclostridium sp. X23]
MVNHKFDVARLDKIIKKTLEAITTSKNQIYDIAEGARKECERLERDLRQLKEQVKQVIETVEKLEQDLKDSRKKLMMLSKRFDNPSKEKLQEVYEYADSLRIELAIKREQEQNMIARRSELEIRIKEAYKTVEKAEGLITQVGMAVGYLSGDLADLTNHLEDIQHKQNLGIKIIKAQEEERQRVARDIHDGPAQSMSNVVLKAEICEKLIDVDTQKAKSELRELKGVVRNCLQDVRRIIYDLRPMSLDDLGLVPTIQRYLSNYQEETGIEVRYRTQGIPDDISPVVSLTVFRIVQEALNNIKKHARAQSVTVKISICNNILTLNIGDDGKGFNLSEVREKNWDHSGGFGLYSMKERVELLNGKFDIQSEIGKGTKLCIQISLISKEELVNEQN